MKMVIKTEKAPLPIGPYNQAVKTGGLVFVSGQLGLDPVSGAMAEGVAAQTRQVLLNLKAVLEAAGSRLEGVVKTTVFLKDMNEFAAMNAVYAEFFPAETAPARSTVEVARLPKDARVEIEAVALSET